jgi:hypothetical protein
MRQNSDSPRHKIQKPWPNWTTDGLGKPSEGISMQSSRGKTESQGEESVRDGARGRRGLLRGRGECEKVEMWSRYSIFSFFYLGL